MKPFYADARSVGQVAASVGSLTEDDQHSHRISRLDSRENAVVPESMAIIKAVSS